MHAILAIKKLFRFFISHFAHIVALSDAKNYFVCQVVMPTVEADVAFGLGKLNLTNDEVKSRVLEALSAVGMSSYLQASHIDL